ncbi:hypothetical protein SAMN05192534_12333 [Alteribacillus persepolensis]|uniref:Uncharacterized protein n=1 Tax=Alteribacillus persepolensis TaxID=568899 RepID=A0A1G8I7Y4_9BACI|nr:hypothetical protein SAMN05192534_12333 [Alteribacillus persepolensis]
MRFIDYAQAIESGLTDKDICKRTGMTRRALRSLKEDWGLINHEKPRIRPRKRGGKL